MNTISPPMIIIFPIVVDVPGVGSYAAPLTRNPTPIKTRDIIATKVPPCKICFLPSLVSR